MNVFRAAPLFVLIALLLTGCWDYRDLENRAFIQSVGVDANPEEAGGGFVVTVENPHPKGAQEAGGAGGGGGGGGSSPSKIIVSETGRTVSQAVLSMSNTIERSPLWSHVNEVVVSDEVARREGIGSILDLFLRSVRLSARARIYVVEGSAGEVIAFQPQFQPMTARHLRGLEQEFAELPRFAEPRNIQDLNRPNNEGALLLPRLSLSGDQLAAGGAAVLERGRLVGWLNEEQAEGANWLLGNVVQSVLQFHCPGTSEGSVTLRLRAQGSRLQTIVKESLPAFTFRVSAAARIVDLSHCALVPTDPSDRHRLEQAAEAALERRVRTAIRRAQDELRTDYLGLGIEVQRNFPEAWRRLVWDDLFPQAPVSVAARIEIRDVGGVDSEVRF